MGRNQQHRTGRTRGRRIFIRVSDQEFEEIRASADMKASASRVTWSRRTRRAPTSKPQKECETAPIV